MLGLFWKTETRENQDFYSRFAPCENVNIPLATSLNSLLRILLKKHLRNVIRVSVLGLALYKVSRVKVGKCASVQ